jgi:hypothetical protein
VIRVSIPTDWATVSATGSDAFACATPLRLAELVALAVSASIGARAPLDKLERSLRAAYASLLAGECVVDVDGRTYAGLDDIILCAGETTLRFFVTSPARMRQGASPANS